MSLLLLPLLLGVPLAMGRAEPQGPPPTQGEVDFLVDFGRDLGPIAPGLGTGINDLSNASAGCWKAWAEQIHPQGGLARIWQTYSNGRFGWQLPSMEHAADAGLGIFFTVVGAPESIGKKDAGTGIPPRDNRAWAEQIARDAQKILDQGLPLRAIEIWNEPDMPGQWQGSKESFARFFAQAGKRLRESMPAEVMIGGPGMATGYGPGQEYFQLILQACKAEGWSPDFLSWHFYHSMPAGISTLKVGSRLSGMATGLGLRKPELILSEWNINLPHPTEPALDDHRAAVFFAAVNSELAHTRTHDSLFFFLQDGFWEAKRDYAGESVGVYTIHGGPKSVLNGMRMFRLASSLPQVRVERRRAPLNLSLLATRQGDRGYLLLSNAFGDIEKFGRQYATYEGVDLSVYHGKDRQLRLYAAGKIPFEKLGGPARDKPLWEKTLAMVKDLRREEQRSSRPVQIAFRGTPLKIVKVWRIDSSHGDPRQDSAFLAAFRKASADPLPRVGQQVLAKLGEQQIGPDLRRRLEEVFQEPNLAAARKKLDALRPQLGTARVNQIAKTAKAAYEQLSDAIPVELSNLPAARLSEVPSSSTVQRAPEGWVVDLPPWTAVLIEVSWKGDEGAGN